MSDASALSPQTLADQVLHVTSASQHAHRADLQDKPLMFCPSGHAKCKPKLLSTERLTPTLESLAKTKVPSMPNLSTLASTIYHENDLRVPMLAPR